MCRKGKHEFLKSLMRQRDEAFRILKALGYDVESIKA